MSEPEITPPVHVEASELSQQRQPYRLRRRLLIGGVSVGLLAAIAFALALWISSSEFEELARKQLIAKLETATGGRVDLASFHWRPLELEADAGGLVIHGREATGEAPYAHIERLEVRVSLLGFWSPRILLRDLVIDRPQLHLIVYRDGSTNQPQPRKPRKVGKPALDTFFDLKASHVAIQDGQLDYENRAAAFDFQDRLAPLDLDANDVSLLIGYVPASAAYPESYRIQTGASDLNLQRGILLQPDSKSTERLVQGEVQATLDLTRSAAYLQSLRITSRSRGIPDRTLEISGKLEDFAHPRWLAKAAGELDMRLLDPITGYSFAPQGIAHLDLSGAGRNGSFRADGSVHVEDGSYIGTGVVATGVKLDARVHADPERLLITSILARLRQGGQIEGEVALEHWLPPLPGAATMQPASVANGKAHGTKRQTAIPAKPPQPADVITIPVNGTVKTNFKNVALDTILEMVVDPPFQHLGLDALIDGPAIATWIEGDVRTLSVVGLLNLIPSGQLSTNASLPGGKVPASGLIDGTYTQRDGAVDLRLLRLHLPSSQLEAHGHLGAYPLTSSNAITLDFHSGNLGEFDTVLRDLGLARNGKSGTAALPIALTGQADFHGSWGGSLVDPRLSGNVKATQLALEMPPLPNANPSLRQPLQPTMIHFDSLEATGSYSSARIAIENGRLHRGKSEITLNGTLLASMANAVASTAPIPSFDGNSLLHLRLRAAKVGIDDLQPFIGQTLPLTGALNAQIDADGPLHALGGAGWVELDEGSVYGEPVSRIRAQGTMASRTLQLASLTVDGEAGRISATGNYDFQSHRFQADANSAGIDLSRSKWLRKQRLGVAGKLEFSVLGSGTLDDPRLEGHATLAGLILGGEPLGGLELTAHTANHAVTYEMTTRLEAAQVVLHGQTALYGDHTTQAKLDFSQFNIGALLKMAHVRGLSGESSLVGTVTVNGPLTRWEDLRGEARLEDLAVTVSGVHLHSDGGVHATLANARLTLDPLHITGEDTDLHAQGSMSLKDKHQLDFAANGSVNLNLLQSLDPALTASGTSNFQIEAHGPLQNPGLRGRVDLQNGALAFEDLHNGLSQIRGSMEFNQNRLEIKSLTAMSGGGLLSVSGYLAYQNGLFANLSATGKGIRIRYPEGVSSQADTTLHLQGAPNNLLLSGEVFITRFAVSPDFDIAALAATTNAVQAIAPPDATSNHLRLDVHIASSPQLNFQNAYAKLAGDVDLHLRGTVASPSLLGRVSITEGSAIIAGTRYDLQRGDILFTNPVRIQPAIDLNATARVEDYDITLGIHGTLDKPTVTYRSDPPLAEADVVALLALGRTENQQRIYTQQQQQAGANPATDALLGGALNATVSSRVQKLFGAGSVKVDPNYLGALGNSTSRIIVEEQLGRNLTLTYATNVNTTSQQLLQAEVAINRHVSLLVARDESGVFSMVIKATRRYR
jgi:translocation and assembly module TamB